MGVAPAEFCAVYQLSICASASCQPGGAARSLPRCWHRQPPATSWNDSLRLAGGVLIRDETCELLAYPGQA